MATDQPPETPIGEQHDNQSHPDSGVETLDNEERGCGFLKEGKTYLRGEVGEDGTLPAFVEFETPIPYLEGQKRNYGHFPGVQFELSVTGPDGLTETNPPGELWNHLDRCKEDRPTGRHMGELRSAHAHDLIMWVGATYYEQPEDFIQECKTQGLSKAIGASKRQEPPIINPARTRLFLIHPNAIPIEHDEDPEEWEDIGRDTHRPGIIGYSYLTRVVHTGMTGSDGEIDWQQWAQDYAARGLMDLATVGTPIPADDDDTAEPDLSEWASADPDAEGMVPIEEVGFHRLRTLVSRTDDAPSAGRNPGHADLVDAMRAAGVEAVREDEAEPDEN